MDKGATEELLPAAQRDPNVLISLVASAATAIIAVTAVPTWQAVSARPWTFLVFVALALALQLVQVEVYNRGATSFASSGLLAIGFLFNPGAAMIVAAVSGFVILAARRGRLNRGVFDAAQLSLAAGAGAAAFHLMGASGWGATARLVPAAVAGAVYMVVNSGLLCLAMSLADGSKILTVWNERFR